LWSKEKLTPSNHNTGNNEHHEPTKRLVEKDGQSIFSQALGVAPIAHNALKEHSDVEKCLVKEKIHD
jgi:hypothetical protein